MTWTCFLDGNLGMVFWPKIGRYYKLEHGKLAELINNGLTILITG